ncbi:MAG: hypothetical protein R2710_00550 [Acidimicrobiales bacterium]
MLVDHPVTITADEIPLTCTLPPRFDPKLPASVDEANGLRRRSTGLEPGRVTSVGRVVEPDGIPGALAVFGAIANGAAWKEAGIPGGNTTAICHDIRTYYEEAALELVDGPPPDGRAAEAWFYEQTEAGKTIMAAERRSRNRVHRIRCGSTWPLAIVDCSSGGTVVGAYGVAMTRIDRHPTHTISWTDLAASDIEGATSFYGDLMGWSVFEVEGSPYRMFMSGDQPVAGDADHARDGGNAAGVDGLCRRR